MASYLEDLISNYRIENQINKVISQIANLIKKIIMTMIQQ